MISGFWFRISGFVNVSECGVWSVSVSVSASVSVCVSVSVRRGMHTVPRIHCTADDTRAHTALYRAAQLSIQEQLLSTFLQS